MNKVTHLADARPTSAIDLPDIRVRVDQSFGFPSDMEVPAYSVRTEHGDTGSGDDCAPVHSVDC